LPADRLARAQVLSWMFFEQYSHEPNVATLRFWTHLPELTPAQELQKPLKKRDGEAALKLMDNRLSSKDWLVGTTPSVADIALYAYTHVAAEGGFTLGDYPAVSAWLRRMQTLPGYIGIGDLPT